MDLPATLFVYFEPHLSHLSTVQTKPQFSIDKKDSNGSTQTERTMNNMILGMAKWQRNFVSFSHIPSIYNLYKHNGQPSSSIKLSENQNHLFIIYDFINMDDVSFLSLLSHAFHSNGHSPYGWVLSMMYVPDDDALLGFVTLTLILFIVQ